jgi:hypothetical protein
MVPKPPLSMGFSYTTLGPGPDGHRPHRAMRPADCPEPLSGTQPLDRPHRRHQTSGLRAATRLGLVSEASYIVSFYGLLNDEARGALHRAGVTLVGSTGAATVAPGGRLPEPNRQYVRARASSERDAINLVRGAVAPYGAYGEFTAQTTV